MVLFARGEVAIGTEGERVHDAPASGRRRAVASRLGAGGASRGSLYQNMPSYVIAFISRLTAICAWPKVRGTMSAMRP
jgi:hypothetical protein